MTGRRKTILDYDDLDARREMYRLLGHPRMTDRRRINFVSWCSQRCGDKMVQVKPAYDKAGYGTHEAIMDLSMLTLQYRLDVDSALAELVRRVRKL